MFGASPFGSIGRADQISCIVIGKWIRLNDGGAVIDAWQTQPRKAA
jgi:hypothetical protein